MVGIIRKIFYSALAYVRSLGVVKGWNIVRNIYDLELWIDL